MDTNQSLDSMINMLTMPYIIMIGFFTYGEYKYCAILVTPVYFISCIVVASI